MSVTLSKQLQSGLLDIAFLIGPVSNPVIINDHLFTVPLIWVASPVLNLHQKEQTMLSLSEWPIITYARNTIPYNEIHQEFAKYSELSTRIFASSSLGVCRRLVLDGMGVSTLPKDLVIDDIEKNLMHEIDVDWYPSELTFTASYPMSLHRPEFRPLIELVKTVVAEYSLR